MTHENRAREEIVRDLKKKIEDGVYAPGERLPSRWKLAEAYGVTGSLMQRATQQLEAAGYVRGIMGKGVYVKQNAGEHVAFWAIRPEEVPASVRVYTRDTNALVLESKVWHPTIFVVPDFGQKCWAEIEPANGLSRRTTRS